MSEPVTQRYRLQSKTSGRDNRYIHYMLTVPPWLAESVPEGAQFQIELTDDGILFRFMGVDERFDGRQTQPVISDPPEWMEE